MIVAGVHKGLVYRPDIDGLRAFAVLSVVLFHAFSHAIPGGFVGVDVFFVISGYLISGIVLTELDQGSFRFSSFYARRIKRIFPALLIVLVCSFVAGWFLLFDDELLQLSNHELRATVFLSNFMLWHEAGYFDNASETKPLLHLWSLAIEEQFYLVWPLMAWGLSRLWRTKPSPQRWLVIAICAAASLGWSLYIAQIDLTHDFYSPLTRFWELLSGSLLAFAVHGKGLAGLSKGFLGEELRGRLGMILLLISVIFIDEGKSFPGVWALMPVAGAVLVIAANRQSSWVNSLLTNVWMIRVGLISYPLYLWHWPVLSYFRIVEGATPSISFRLVGVLISFVLASLTYVAVERPVRFTWTWKYKTPVLLVLMVMVALGSYVAKNAAGYPERAVMSPSNVLLKGDIGHDAFHAYYKSNLYPCADEIIRRDAGVWLDVVRCFQTRPQGEIDTLLLGDSHAEHLLAGLAESMPERNIAFYGKGALPLLGSPEFKIIFERVLKNPDIQDIFITANWPGRWKERSSAQAMEEDITVTLKAFINAGKHVVLIGDTPKFAFDPQRCKYRRPLSSGTQCEISASLVRAQQDTYWPLFQAVQRTLPKVRLITLEKVFCHDDLCSMAIEDKVMFRDSNHLNILGSRRVANFIQQNLYR